MTFLKNFFFNSLKRCMTFFFTKQPILIWRSTVLSLLRLLVFHDTAYLEWRRKKGLTTTTFAPVWALRTTFGEQGPFHRTHPFCSPKEFLTISSKRIQTLDLRTSSWGQYHCANVAGQAFGFKKAKCNHLDCCTHTHTHTHTERERERTFLDKIHSFHSPKYFLAFLFFFSWCRLQQDSNSRS